MIQLKALAFLSVLFSLKIILADEKFSSEEKMDILAIFCGGCRNTTAQDTVMKFGECLEKNLPELLKVGSKVYLEHINDTANCLPAMDNQIKEFGKANKGELRKMAKCFKDTIPDRKVIASCKSN